MVGSMREKDYKRVQNKLDAIDNFGENLGSLFHRGCKYLWSKIKLILILLTAGTAVLLFSLVNGLSGRNKNIKR